MGLGCSPRSLAESPEAPGTKELFGEPEGRGVATPLALGPTCPSSLLPGHASTHLPLWYFLEPPALCLCSFLRLVGPFPNFHRSSLIKAFASFSLP